MTVANRHLNASYDVIVIGGGPAGLAAATELKRLGVSDVAVLDREPEAGGIPRHCGHPPFGMREFSRILTGPQYAKKLVRAACRSGVKLLTSTTVVEANPGGNLLVATPHGVEETTARRIVIATGVRETPRSARLVSGTRPLGVINTGALQAMIYLKNRIPFRRPVIVGTELVSFSAALTCRHARIRPVAMLEASSQVIARWPASLFPMLTGLPLHLETRLMEIEGGNRVSGVIVGDGSGNRRKITCDGVILTGRFTPEASLALNGHLRLDVASGGPEVDQFGRCSDPAYFAAGNVLRPVETAGWSWNEGRQTARWVVNDLAGKGPDRIHELTIAATSPIIGYVMPQKIALPHTRSGMQCVQLRFSRVATGDLVARTGRKPVWSKRVAVRPERRLLVPLDKLVCQGTEEPIELEFNELGQ